MYADYSYYKDVYRGKLTEENYTPFAEFAAAYIDSKTDRLFEKEGLPQAGSSLDKRLKTCACALADERHNTAFGENRVKVSETVGSHSVSYSAEKVRTEDERLFDILDLYLSDIVKAVKWV